MHCHRILLRAISAMILASSTSLHAETLQTIYQDAIENDHVFKAAQATRDAGLEDKTIARAALLPQINAQAVLQKSDVDDDRQIGLTNEEGDLIGSTQFKSTNKTDFEQVSVGLTQSILNIGAWHNYKRGETLADLAEVEFRRSEQALILRVSEAYFNTLNAVDNLTTAIAETEALRNQLEQSEQRFEVGLTAITEVHESQAAFDSATARKLAAEGNLGIAFEALEVLTGKNYVQLAPVKNDLSTAPPNEDRVSWVNIAIENSAELAAAKLRMIAAKRGAAEARASHYPTLTGELSYGQSEVDPDIRPQLPPEEQFQVAPRTSDEASITLRLNVPLFSGLGTSATRRKAYYEYQAQLENYQQTQRTVKQNTRTAYLSVLTSAATVKALKQATVSSRSALEATQAGYDVGTRDLVDVLNAQRALFAAQRDFYDALYSYILATLELRAAAGILSGADIANLESLLDPARAGDYRNL